MSATLDVSHSLANIEFTRRSRIASKSRTHQP
jgi:hypothetical protein